jgi:hypothetical protein
MRKRAGDIGPSEEQLSDSLASGERMNIFPSPRSEQHLFPGEVSLESTVCSSVGCCCGDQSTKLSLCSLVLSLESSPLAWSGLLS